MSSKSIPAMRPSASRPFPKPMTAGGGILLLATLFAAMTSGTAEARPGYGSDIDTFCLGYNGTTPDADQSCDLCHSNDYGEYISPAWDWYFDPQQWFNFCDAAAPVVNLPPVLDAIGNQSVNQFENLAFTVSASDPDGNNLSFSASGLPTGASLTDNGNGSADFSWTPDAQQSGNFPVTFSVSDDGVPVESDAEPITISVGIPNQPPVLDAIGPQAASVGVELAFTVTASDPDGDGLTLSAANLPTGATFSDNLDGSGSFRWTPQAGQEGGHAILFSVVDSGVPQGKDSEEVTVTVAGGNSAPVLAPIGDRTAEVGVALDIALSASDADGDALSFAVDPTPAGATFTDNGDGTADFSWTPTATDVSQSLTFSVSDDYAPPASDSETVAIALNGSNQPPLLAPIGNHAVYAGELLEIALSASDADGDALRFSAAPLPLGAELIDNADGTALLRWLPSADQAGDHVLTVSVADNGVPEASDAEDIRISVMNPDPVVVAGEVDIRRAIYKARRGKLVVRGRGEPGATVEVSDSDTGERLGSVLVNDEGRWKLRLKGFDEAPASVTATSGGFSDTAEVQERKRERKRRGKQDRGHDREHDEHDDDDDREEQDEDEDEDKDDD